jgi:hypothetical protein
MAAGYREEEVAAARVPFDRISRLISTPADSADSKYARCSAKLISMPHRDILAPCLFRFPHHSLD